MFWKKLHHRLLTVYSMRLWLGCAPLVSLWLYKHLTPVKSIYEEAACVWFSQSSSSIFTEPWFLIQTIEIVILLLEIFSWLLDTNETGNCTKIEVFHKGFLLWMWPNLQEMVDLVTFAKESLDGKLYFLYSGSC